MTQNILNVICKGFPFDLPLVREVPDYACPIVTVKSTQMTLIIVPISYYLYINQAYYVQFVRDQLYTFLS